MKPCASRLAALSLCAAATWLAPIARAQDASHFKLSISDKGCTPNEVTVPNGDISISLSNDSKKAIEWEILSGVKVLYEKEHILPGFKLELKTKVPPGTYEMTCGLLSNPKGKLTVQGANQSGAAEKPASGQSAALGLAYRSYALAEAAKLEVGTRDLVAAIKQGKLEDAQKLYAPTRVHYERIEPIAELFADLDPAIDARADSFEKKEADPAFTGFHRIEKGLFADRQTAGLDQVAEKLLTDVQELNKRIATLDVPGGKVIAGAQILIEEIAGSKIAGEEEHYSGTDLYDIQANIEGSVAAFDLAAPLAKDSEKALMEKIRASFADANAVLSAYREGEAGFKPYAAVTPEHLNLLKVKITVLAENLATLKGHMGL
jgi:iron uptake system component EfeO